MFATGDPLVAKPTGRWTEGRVSGTRRAWPQGRRLFLREKHRLRKRQELPFAGDAAPGLAVGLLRKHRHPAGDSGSVPKGRRIFLRGNRLPGEAAKSVRGWRCLDPAPRLPRRRGARVKGPGRRQRPVVRKGSALQRARGRPPQGTGSPGTPPCSSGPMPGTLSVPGAGPAPGASGGCPARTPNAGFPSQRPDALFFTIWPPAAPLDFVARFAPRPYIVITRAA